jgi:hypothetical protein
MMSSTVLTGWYLVVSPYAGLPSWLEPSFLRKSITAWAATLPTPSGFVLSVDSLSG